MDSPESRAHILDESLRVLKPGGYYFLQIDSPELGFFAERLNVAPGPDSRTLYFPNGKVESFLIKEDISNWDDRLKIIEIETKIENNLTICGNSSPYQYFWIVARVGLA